MKTQKNKYQKTLLTLSSLALLPTLAFAGNHAYADSARYQTEVTPSLILTIPTDSINITVDPSSKPFDSKDLNIIVATNNLTGYNLTMSSDSVNLIKTNDDSKTISTLTANEGGYTSSTFETNKWGYKIGDGNYIPFVSGTTIGGSDTTTNNDITALNFAAKVDYVQPAGEYKTVLNFLAVANPIPVLYAQDLDFAHCPATPLTVVDNRDNEEYIVQRLEDGNCWMLDNLRLDPTEVSLETLKGNTNATDESLTYLKNGGGTGQYAINGVASSETTLTPYTRTSPAVVTGYKDTVASTYYGSSSGKVGVYYNYCAVSAGSYCYDSHDDTNDATEDICPAGWRLPKSSGSDLTGNEFNDLRLAYSDGSAFGTAIGATVTGGFFYTSDNPTSYSSGYYWSSTYETSGQMHYATISESGTSPNFGTDRSRAFSARCILNK
jgi:hypothetical protein